MANPSVQIETVAKLEDRIETARQRAAAALRAAREARGLSLRQVGPHVGITYSALSNLERGESWETTTARRVAAFYGEPGDESAAA